MNVEKWLLMSEAKQWVLLFDPNANLVKMKIFTEKEVPRREGETVNKKREERISLC